MDLNVFQKPHHGIMNDNKINHSTSFLVSKKPGMFKRFWYHIDGSIWGFCDGLITGTLAGVSATNNAGGWFIGSISSFIAAITGGILGSIYGSTIGLFSNREVVTRLLANYRKDYGNRKIK